MSLLCFLFKNQASRNFMMIALSQLKGENVLTSKILEIVFPLKRYFYYRPDFMKPTKKRKSASRSIEYTIKKES